jgi:hypothetical protein
MVPLTYITLEPEPLAAVVRALNVVTVCGVALPPPVVPPFCVHQPLGAHASCAFDNEKNVINIHRSVNILLFICVTFKVLRAARPGLSLNETALLVVLPG